MADINIDGVVTWLKNWFYDKTEITGFLNTKANQSDLQTTNGNLANLSSTVDNKVDKITGKGLSTEDFTTTLKDKLDGIEDGANKITVDSALSSTSTNPVQNKVVNTALSGKAPTSHASSATTYGVGTTSNYGHVKTVNDLTQSSHSNGTALSAYQGKVLKDLVDGKADSTHSHGTADITESSALSNIGTSANATQSAINSAINTKFGELLNIEFFKIVTTLPSASLETCDTIYLLAITGSGDNNFAEYITVFDLNSQSVPTNFRWEKLGEVSGSGLSVDWADITSKPSTFTPSSHSHGNISNDGKITSIDTTIRTGNAPIIALSDGNLKKGVFYCGYAFDSASYSNIGSSANATQNTINSAIDTALGAKGNSSDDIDWSYNSNGFTNGVKLVDKTTNANGRITLHLKS